MLRHLIYPFLPYRSFFLPILVVSAITVPCWLVVRIHRLRASGQRPSFLRETLLLIAVLYLSGLAATTLTPSHPSRQVAEATVGMTLRPDAASLTCSAAKLPSGSTSRGFCVRNARGNVLLFFPLGVLLPLVWTGLRFRNAIAVAIALSCSIELAQYVSRSWGSYRTADINDVILNVVGAVLGLGLVYLTRLREVIPPAIRQT